MVTVYLASPRQIRGVTVVPMGGRGEITPGVGGEVAAMMGVLGSGRGGGGAGNAAAADGAGCRCGSAGDGAAAADGESCRCGGGIGRAVVVGGEGGRGAGPSMSRGGFGSCIGTSIGGPDSGGSAGSSAARAGEAEIPANNQAAAAMPADPHRRTCPPRMLPQCLLNRRGPHAIPFPSDPFQTRTCPRSCDSKSAR